MKEFKYVIKDEQGIHARPAGLLGKEAAAFPCKVTIEKDGKDSLFSGYWKVYNNPGRAKMIFWAYDKAKTSAVNEYLIGKSIRDIAYVAACQMIVD